MMYTSFMLPGLVDLVSLRIDLPGGASHVGALNDPLTL